MDRDGTTTPPAASGNHPSWPNGWAGSASRFVVLHVKCFVHSDSDSTNDNDLSSYAFRSLSCFSTRKDNKPTTKGILDGRGPTKQQTHIHSVVDCLRLCLNRCSNVIRCSQLGTLWGRELPYFMLHELNTHLGLVKQTYF